MALIRATTADCSRNHPILVATTAASGGAAAWRSTSMQIRGPRPTRPRFRQAPMRRSETGRSVGNHRRRAADRERDRSQRPFRQRPKSRPGRTCCVPARLITEQMQKNRRSAQTVRNRRGRTSRGRCLAGEAPNEARRARASRTDKLSEPVIGAVDGAAVCRNQPHGCPPKRRRQPLPPPAVTAAPAADASPASSDQLAAPKPRCRCADGGRGCARACSQARPRSQPQIEAEDRAAQATCRNRRTQQAIASRTSGLGPRRRRPATQAEAAKRADRADRPSAAACAPNSRSDRIARARGPSASTAMTIGDASRIAAAAAVSS